MEDECCGGDPLCWAHLFEDDEQDEESTSDGRNLSLAISIPSPEELAWETSTETAAGSPRFESE